MRFFRAKPRIRELQVMKPPVPPEKDALASLGIHPGFRYLMQKLDLSRAHLKERVAHESFENIQQVARMQGFLEGLDWMDRVLLSEIGRADEREKSGETREAMPDEMAVFNSLDEFIVEVGKQ